MTSYGIGTLALGSLLNPAALAAPPVATNPFAARAPHFAPKAKRVIFLFMAGAPSQLDLFDPKPKLNQ
ncbi:MAG TPA: sulfatase, partial [Armatimonadetes bacterium]|nr:sulfatase [Armatimonadota bacterium]